MSYSSQQHFKHEDELAVGLLLVNLGTPDAPTASALRRYLKQFLWDPRIVEMSRPLWWLILHGYILNVRPAKSAKSYQRVWGKDGSPLLAISLKQQQGIVEALEAESDKLRCSLHVELGMTYGSPSIESALRSLREKRCKKIMVLPLFPQYSAASTAAATDVVFSELKRWRRVPDLRVCTSYHDSASYIAALASSVREHWETHGKGEKLLISFHGIPERFFKAGDPYPCYCRKTARLLVESLSLNEGQWEVAFQSRFGREEWIKPYTSEVLKGWGHDGVSDVDIICPGFAADCLETLEEIAIENCNHFVASGGKALRYIPALNDRDDHIQALVQIVKSEMYGWL
ncbi:MAG: ferrochelatase [Mariprofundaceae bacterium]